MLSTPNTKTAESSKIKILVTSEFLRAQLASLRPTTASPPWSSPQNTKKPDPATEESVLLHKGYSDAEAADRILIQQVRRESHKNKSNDTSRPESAATSSLLAMATVATAASSRPALQTITPNPTAASVVTVGGINDGILPSPERNVRKTSHQEQISKQNETKRKAVHTQAHAHATTLIA